MKEIELNNCYNLYEEKFGEPIKDILEKIIQDSKNEVDSELEVFVQKHFVEPIPADNPDHGVETREKRILNEVIKCKNSLLDLQTSPYLHLYIAYQNDIPQFARHITWHWLSSPAASFPLSTQLKFKNLKEILFSIGYNSSIYYWNDRFISILEEKDPAPGWPKKEHVEIYHLKQLEEKLKQQEKLKEALEKHYQEKFKNQEELENLQVKQLKEKLNQQMQLNALLEIRYNQRVNQLRDVNKNLDEELDQNKDNLSQYRAELQLLKGPFFFYEDGLYKDYVFGDILPELKSVYNLLKEYKIYESNWGYFCYCLTWNNCSTGFPEQQKLTFNIQNSDLTADDLGYILHILKRHYFYESQLPYLQWLINTIEIISGHGKKFTSEEDYIKFNEKSIRSYKTGKSRPNFYAEINTKLNALL